jgi:predicted Fe-Mo cluster-binding NifX family protein
VRIAITSQGDSLEAAMDSRFGRCAHFVLVDSETGKTETLANPAVDAAGGAGPLAAQTIADKGVQVVITGNVGPNAAQTLKAAKITVYQAAPGTVRENLEKYKNGELEQLADSSVPDHFGLRQGRKS